MFLQWRCVVKRIPILPHGYYWWKRNWQDLKLYLLTQVGYIPSHCIRGFIYRRSGISLPKNSAIHWRARFFSPEGISIGEYTTVGNDAFFDGREGVFIGSCVNIAAEVRIYTLEHDIDDPDFGSKGGPVHIGDYVYIGSRVTILPGVTIGKGAVIATGAVVTRNVHPYMLVGGVPAKVIRERSHDLRYKLGGYKKFQ